MPILEIVRNEVDEYLATHTAVVSSAAAADIADNMDPQVLAAWMWERRHDILAAYITNRCRMNGSKRATEERHSVFASAANNLEEILHDEAETGDAGPRQEFFKMWQCGTEGGKPVRKRLGDMNRDELAYHRGRQENSIRYYMRRVKFLALIEDRLEEGQIVGDIFNPEELDAILASIT